MIGASNLSKVLGATHGPAYELAPHGLLARGLVANGEGGILMSRWNVWRVSVLSAGRLDGAGPHYNNYPPALDRTNSARRLAVVRPAGEPYSRAVGF